MSKYKVGDKVVVEIEKAALTDNGGGMYTVLDYMQSAISVDEKSEPLATYTEPLERKNENKQKQIEKLVDKLHRQAAEITRLLEENKELKEESKRNYTINIEMARAEGHSEAWELARKIASTAGGLSSSELVEIFNAFLPRDILSNNTYAEAAAKVAEWEKAKEEVKVGDVVRFKNNNRVEFCVTDILEDSFLYGIDAEGSVFSGRNIELVEKTGRHIDIDGFLKQIGGEE